MAEPNNPTDTHDMEFNQSVDPFKELVFMQLRRIMEFSNCEFRGGYYSKQQTSDGNEKEFYVPDTREIFCNAVHAFSLLLIPKYDKQMKTYHVTFIKDLAKIKQDFIETSSVKETIILGDSFYEDEKDKLLLEEYKEKKLQLYLALFSELNLLLSRDNYLTYGGQIS